MAFKILSFDGGGYRGRLTALMLVELQKAIDTVCAQKQIPSKSILDCFDLIAGTSTGSLIAAALSIGRSADDVLDIFRNDGAAIFPSQSFIDLIFKAASVPLFDGSELENVLQKPLLITAYDSWNNRPLAFRSYDPACNGIRLFDACRGSSAYPAGFPSHVLKDDQETNPYFQSLRQKRSYFSFDHSCEGRDGIPLIDGGIGANNPAALALAESIGSQSLKTWLADQSPMPATAQETLLVSFGTGQMPPGINYAKGRGFSAKDWNGNLGNPLLEMMFVGYSRISDELCRTIIGDHNYFRFQPVLLPEAVD